jgi:hypothetical protein
MLAPRSAVADDWGFELGVSLVSGLIAGYQVYFRLRAKSTQQHANRVISTQTGLFLIATKSVSIQPNSCLPSPPSVDFVARWAAR